VCENADFWRWLIAKLRDHKEWLPPERQKDKAKPKDEAKPKEKAKSKEKTKPTGTGGETP
jgi:hypothetical protein